MPLKIIRNDITKMNTEAIVNTANSKPLVGTGCDYAVYMAAGYDELLEFRTKNIGEVKEGDVFITPGFHLPVKYIIHAVSPKYMEDDEELSFSIENFKLVPLEKGKLVATFKVTEMPLNLEDLNIDGAASMSMSSSASTSSNEDSTESKSGDVYTNNPTGNAAKKEAIKNAINNVNADGLAEGLSWKDLDEWIKSAEKGNKKFDAEIKKQLDDKSTGKIKSSDSENKKYSGTATLDGVSYSWTCENGKVTLTEK